MSECVLVFGALRNGNLGDVAQSASVARLLRDVDADMCIYMSSVRYEPRPQYRLGELITDERFYAGDLDCSPSW